MASSWKAFSSRWLSHSAVTIHSKTSFGNAQLPEQFREPFFEHLLARVRLAAQHTSDATVRANMVSAYLRVLQEAVVAIEQELGRVSNLTDSTLLELTADGELILAAGSGNGYRFAELGAAKNPNGWAGVLKVKTPTGTTLR